MLLTNFYFLLPRFTFVVRRKHKKRTCRYFSFTTGLSFRLKCVYSSGEEFRRRERTGADVSRCKTTGLVPLLLYTVRSHFRFVICFVHLFDVIGPFPLSTFFFFFSSLCWLSLSPFAFSSSTFHRERNADTTQWKMNRNYVCENRRNVLVCGDGGGRRRFGEGRIKAVLIPHRTDQGSGWT